MGTVSHCLKWAVLYSSNNSNNNSSNIDNSNVYVYMNVNACGVCTTG